MCECIGLALNRIKYSEVVEYFTFCRVVFASTSTSVQVLHDAIKHAIRFHLKQS